MRINNKKLEKLGITLDESKSPVVAYAPNDISESTKHDLWLAFEGDISITSIDAQLTSSPAIESNLGPSLRGSRSHEA